jgi:CubicO group peptidase (beta-lactamase class C family)
MTYLRGSLLAATLCWISLAALAKEPNAVDAEEFRQWITQEQQKGGYVGVAAVLIVDGKVVLRQGFGYADKHNGVIMTPTTQVGIGSVTKTFTALAALQLQSRGVVDIDKPLSTYLPQFHIKTHGENLDEVTLKALITHTSGVPTDVYKYQDLEHARYTDVVSLINETAMAHPPGIVGMYSNSGYNMLAHALDKASGVEYPKYLQRQIFSPLGMKNTGFAWDQGRRARTKSYNPDGTEASPPELRDIASGGIYSTVDDLALYAKAMMAAYNGKRSAVVDKEIAQPMFTLQNAAVPIESNKKGLGWFLFKNDKQFAAYHSGSTIYANASLLLIPQQNAAAIMLVNTVGGTELCQQFAFRFLERSGLSVKDIVPPPSNLPIEAAPPASTHAGYYARRTSYAKVSADGEELLIERDGKKHRVRKTAAGTYQQEGEASNAAGRYYFRDLGPYHVMFFREGDREQALGYRVPEPTLDTRWARRLGPYQLFGYGLLGFEKVVSAEVAVNQEGLPVLKVIYTTGAYTYTLVNLGRDEARIGGLGPANTGDMVYFSGEPDSEVLTYLGLTFKRQNP